MKAILTLLFAFGAQAYAANYGCTAINTGDYDVIFRAEGKDIKNWRTFIGQHGKNLKPRAEVDERTNEFSFMVDDSNDTVSYIHVYIRNGEVLKSQVWQGGNDSDNYWAKPTGMTDICERVSN